ncbi:MAG: hypothetical protein FWH20_02400 [Oscillospiraceae bacterium]|nr:hypothetical protein [Oscillospiraceae bacterium]
MKIKRIIALIVSLMLLVGIFTACTDDGPATTDSGDNTGTTVTPGGPDESDPGAVTPAPGTAPAADLGIQGVDFSNGNIGFLDMYYKPVDAKSGATVELTTFRGASAAKVTPVGSSVPYVVIDAASLLGDKVTEARTIEIGIASDRPDGSFMSVSGEILTFRNWEESRAGSDKGKWSVFIDSMNPNTARLTIDQPLGAGEGNFFVLRKHYDAVQDASVICSVCGSANKNAAVGTDIICDYQDFAVTVNEDGEEVYVTEINANGDEVFVYEGDPCGNVIPNLIPSNLIITAIGFKDADGNYLDVNADAVFTAPENFNDMGTPYIIELGDFSTMNNINNANQSGWLTQGVDGKDSFLSAEDFQGAVMFVMELESPPEGTVQLIWMGDGNSWSWTQEPVIAEGTATETVYEFNLAEVFGNYEAWPESTQFKFYISYFGTDDNESDVEGLGIINAYFIGYA